MTPWNGRNALTAMNLLFGNIDAVRPSIRPEARIQGYIIEGGTAPNVVPDRTVADFYIRYPDEVYLAQVVEFVDNAAKAAALATGTKVKIDHYSRLVDGVSLATLGDLGFAYMKSFGATGVTETPGKPQGFEETGSVSRDIPGIGITAQSSTFSNHTYEMDADNLKEIGHKGFTVDAQAMTAVLFDFATHADYRAAVKKEFDGIKALFGEYQAALKKTYTVPTVPDRTVADFYIRYPDEVYLQQVVEFVDNAAKAAALATGTKVKIDHYGKDLDGVSLATLHEVAFQYMKNFGATGVNPEHGKPQGFEETGSVSRDIPGVGVTAQSSTFSNHTYEMDADNLKEIGHKGFTVDAQTMSAILFDFATRPEYRAAVKKEFDGIKALFGEYQAALKKVYTVPAVADPK